MNSFSYVSAQSAESAVELVREDGRFLAGGMDLLGEIKEALITPKTLVNIKALPNTRDIVPGATWQMGANVTLAVLAARPDIRQILPGVAEAAAEVGSPQIRNVGTLGGNLAQHSRCWYYRHRDVHCRKKGGTSCYARQGENKYHSLFTGSMCLSPCVSNLAIALAALDARVIVQRGAKTESRTIAELYQTAWKTAAAHNALGEGELILRVEITPGKRRSTYLQLAEKSDFDWALVSCAAAAEVHEGKFSQVRIALGAIAPIPWQVTAANALLEGKAFSPELAAQAADLILRDATPRSHNAYKLPVARVLIQRALAKLAA